MKRICFDTETDGLLPDLTVMHTLVLRDLDSDAVLACADQDGYPTIQEGLDVLAKAELIVGHNVLSFDLPAIGILYPNWKSQAVVRDTLVLARLIWPHVGWTDWTRVRAGRLSSTLVGRHSLSAWGQRLGLCKGDFATSNAEEEDWSTWSPEMTTYCEQDTKVTRRLYSTILDKHPSAESVELEHKLATYLARQVENGFPFRLDEATALSDSLAEQREALAAELGVATRDDLATLLQTEGWEATEYYPDGRPKISPLLLQGWAGERKDRIEAYLNLDTAIGLLTESKKHGWATLATALGPFGGKLTGLTHIHPGINPNATSTHRAAYYYPNLQNVAGLAEDLANECRALFPAPEGWKLAAIRVTNLELACLANYMHPLDGGAFGRATGSDFADVLGLTGKERAFQGVLWYQGLISGAGERLLGATIFPDSAESRQTAAGRWFSRRFRAAYPAFGQLWRAVVERVGTNNGVLTMADGRLTQVQHARLSLPSLLQAGSSILMKQWLVLLDSELTARYGPQGWDGQWAGVFWHHDELLIAAREEISDDVAYIALLALHEVAEKAGWKVPLNGETAVGSHWKAASFDQ